MHLDKKYACFTTLHFLYQYILVGREYRKKQKGLVL